MTLLPGEQLDHFLERRRLTLPVVPTSPRQHFSEACTFTHSLLEQLAPAFVRVAGVAYHRDANLHNILINNARCEVPKFGLIDFGLAVDVTRWTGPEYARAWMELGVSGDCRYWTTSSWMMFTHGIEELEKYPKLCTEYARRLDLHSIGLSALQVLCAMAPATSDSIAKTSDGDDVLVKLENLRVAWDRYWEDVSVLWHGCVTTFTSGGCMTKIQKEYRKARVHDLIMQDMKSLRHSLRALIQALSASPSSASLKESRTLSSIRTLISAGEDSAPEPNWQQVCLLLDVQPPKPAKTVDLSGTVQRQQSFVRSCSKRQMETVPTTVLSARSPSTPTLRAPFVSRSSLPGCGLGRGQNVFDRSLMPVAPKCF
eukprot:gnl/TRDRNA2_/TRDRNA2_116849_c0_seq1.p1 gnl/TRDRNA2_/TRDRNA2_116849_c0~~gnl/TRDRNA2_/TRDRNA2_116849_c0_seq1.p1  ORF type:complete len:370 (+),score=26.29 gnl/TRDRNA2_/TRDRNA2_116849_c0_seq1:163-1272(+)